MKGDEHYSTQKDKINEQKLRPEILNSFYHFSIIHRADFLLFFFFLFFFLHIIKTTYRKSHRIRSDFIDMWEHL